MKTTMKVKTAPGGVGLFGAGFAGEIDGRRVWATLWDNRDVTVRVSERTVGESYPTVRFGPLHQAEIVSASGHSEKWWPAPGDEISVEVSAPRVVTLNEQGRVIS